MQRVTIAIDDELLEVVDRLRQQRGYESRSEAVRDIVREAASHETAEADNALCVAVLSYVFDFDIRDLAQRLARTLHDHHDLVAASVRVPLDHTTCLELATLRGRAGAIRAFADEITTQRGVRHANLHLVPGKASPTPHRHHDEGHAHVHFKA